MFALFFSEKPVRNLGDATRSDTQNFNKLFRHALEQGVYLPPSAYETCFLCTAHDGDDIAQAAEILSAGIAAI